VSLISSNPCKFIQKRTRVRYSLLKITALQGKLTFGEPFLDSGVVGKALDTSASANGSNVILRRARPGLAGLRPGSPATSNEQSGPRLFMGSTGGEGEISEQQPPRKRFTRVAKEYTPRAWVLDTQAPSVWWLFSSTPVQGCLENAPPLGLS